MFFQGFTAFRKSLYHDLLTGATGKTLYSVRFM